MSQRCIESPRCRGMYPKVIGMYKRKFCYFPFSVALQHGLVSRIVPHEKLEEEVRLGLRNNINITAKGKTCTHSAILLLTKL